MSKHVERSRKHLDFLDEIRGVAILAVFLYHALGPAFGRNELAWGHWFSDFNVPSPFLFFLPLSVGWCGVAIFFVVSGFCIHLSFVRRPEWRDFFLRRFFRIYPPYFFAVLLFALFLPWSHAGYWPAGLAQVTSHLALVHNLFSDTFFGINGPFWSIGVEVQLYLLYPLLLFFTARWGWRRSLWGVGALEIGLRALSAISNTTEQPFGQWFSGLPVIYWFSWAIGAAIAEAYLAGSPIPFSRHSLPGWGALAVASSFSLHLRPFSFLFFALLTATAIARLLTRPAEPVRWPFLTAPLRTIGQWSFSIYLLHGPLLHAARPVAARLLPGSGAPSPVAVFAISLGLAVPIFAVSAAWYYLLELPSIALGKRFSRRLSARAIPTTDLLAPPAANQAFLP